MSEWLLSDMVTPTWVWLICVALLAFCWLRVHRLLEESGETLEEAQAYYFAARLHTALRPSSPTDTEKGE
jgi:hypothetical protein